MTPSAAAQSKRGLSSNPTQQQEVKELIQDLKQACRRPLFVEIVHEEARHDLPAAQQAQTTADSRKPKRLKSNPRKSWEQVRMK